MRYAVLTAIPFVGHLNPLLRQAQELQRRGWRVAVAATSEMAAHAAAEAPDVPFLDLGPLGPIAGELRRLEARASANPDYRRGALILLPTLALVWPTMFDGLVEALRRDRPDVLVVDLFSSAGFCAAEVLGLPFVVNNPSLLTGVPIRLMPPAPSVPFMASGRSIHDIGWLQRATEPLVRHAMAAGVAFTVGRQLNRLRLGRGLHPVRVHDLLRGRTILVNGVFGLEYPRPLPPNVAMVGPMLTDTAPSLPPELDAWLSTGPPVVYVNLGTVSIAPQSQLAKMAHALSADGLRALWVLKPEQAALLPAALSPHVRVVSWVPSQRAVLEHRNVRVFVSHCGSSVWESLSAGTPIVGIPTLADQRDMAVRVADAGVGLWMDKTRFTSDELRSAIRCVLHEPSFREPVSAVQAAIARAGGLRRAADLIEAAAAAPRHPAAPRRAGASRA